MNPSFWSPNAQAKRILTDAWRFLRLDMALGILYVCIATFYFLPSVVDGVLGTFVYPAPGIIVASIVMTYLAARLTVDAAQPATGTFYANLPRDRKITDLVHAGLLLAYGALLALIVIAMVKLGVTSYRVKVPFQFPLMHMLTPYICTGLCLMVTRGKSLILGARALLALLFLIGYNSVIHWLTAGAYGASAHVSASFIITNMIILMLGILVFVGISVSIFRGNSK